MRKLALLSVSTLGTVLALCLMAPTGGIPSRPTFQQVTVNGAVLAGSLTDSGAASAQSMTIGPATTATTGSLSVYNYISAASMGLTGGISSATANVSGTATIASVSASGITTGGLTTSSLATLASANVTGALTVGSSGSYSLKNMASNAYGAPVISAPSTGSALTVTGVASPYIPSVVIQGSTVSSDSNGLTVSAGTGNTSEAALMVQNAAGSAPGMFRVSGDGSITVGGAAAKGSQSFNSPAIYLNGNLLPRVASAVVAWVGGSSCTLNAGLGTTGCTYNGTGNYTASFSPAFNAVYGCTATPAGSLATPYETSVNWNTSGVTIASYTTGGAASNQTVSIICIGV